MRSATKHEGRAGFGASGFRGCAVGRRDRGRDRDDNITAYAAQWYAETHTLTPLTTAWGLARFPRRGGAVGSLGNLSARCLGGLGGYAAHSSGTDWESAAALNYQSHRWRYAPKLTWRGRMCAA